MVFSALHLGLEEALRDSCAGGIDLSKSNEAASDEMKRS